MSEEKQEQKQMTDEEAQKAVDEHKKAWDAFNKTLTDNPDEP